LKDQISFWKELEACQLNKLTSGKYKQKNQTAGFVINKYP